MQNNIHGPLPLLNECFPAPQKGLKEEHYLVSMNGSQVAGLGEAFAKNIGEPLPATIRARMDK